MTAPEQVVYDNDNAEAGRSGSRSIKKMGVIGVTLLLTSCHAGCHANAHHAGGSVGMGVEVAPGSRSHEPALTPAAAQVTPVDMRVGHQTVDLAEATR
ncbi:MAG TPA: hypothetical protein VFH39_01315 [Candidatus Saccharimonadales bacterium]|nr:hypothetical protein [Candidatus Saccharimonadales bacterium]